MADEALSSTQLKRRGVVKLKVEKVSLSDLRKANACAAPGGRDESLSRVNNVVSQHQGATDPTEVFRRHYGHSYHFYFFNLRDASHAALRKSNPNKRLLLGVLLHDAICRREVEAFRIPGIRSYLLEHFVIWGYDVTKEIDRQRFVEMVRSEFPAAAADIESEVEYGSFPKLVIVNIHSSPPKMANVIDADIICVNDIFMSKLIDVVHEVDDAMAAEQSEMNQREADQRAELRRQQDLAYEASLQSDRAKEAASTIHDPLIQVDGDSSDTLAGVSNLVYPMPVFGPVPPEPAGDADVNNTCQLRIHLPGNVPPLSRKFSMTDKIKDVLNYVGAQGFPSTGYRVLYSFPKRDMSACDQFASLRDMRLSARESLSVVQRIEATSV